MTYAAQGGIRIPARLRASGSRGYETQVLDVSLGGFIAIAINRLHPGALCWLALQGLESKQARVLWWQDGLVGAGFERLLCPIVLEHLNARWKLPVPAA